MVGNTQTQTPEIPQEVFSRVEAWKRDVEKNYKPGIIIYDLMELAAKKHDVEYWDEDDYRKMPVEVKEKLKLVIDHEEIEFEDADDLLNEWDTYIHGSHGGLGVWKIKHNGKVYYFMVEGDIQNNVLSLKTELIYVGEDR